ncbi:neuropilin and tolloid-like protein 2 [Ptychodera flava]|uniref:neuropilin and tolloid-like protein 2 n=1 Tax=Ptychodera flava TaxID=63121 RepID=UPI003969C9C3
MDTNVKYVLFALVALTNTACCHSHTVGTRVKTKEIKNILRDRDRRGAGDCGGTYTGTGGVFSSPGYPENYYADASCYYHLLAPENYTIYLTFTIFDLEDEFDYLHLYDGESDISFNSHLELTGLELPSTFASSTNQLYLVFTSDHSVSGLGFYATYIAFLGNSSDINHGPNITVIESGSSYVQSVGGIIRSHVMDLYTSSYHDNATVPSQYSLTFLALSPFDRIFLRFTHIDIFNNNPYGGCDDGDVLLLTDDVIDIMYCGDGSQEVHDVELSLGSSLHFNVNTQPYGSYKGFQANYALFYQTTDAYCYSSGEFLCNSGQCISYVLVCDDFEHCPDGSDEFECGEEAEHKESNAGKIGGIVGTVVGICCVYSIHRYHSRKHSRSATAPMTGTGSTSTEAQRQGSRPREGTGSNERDDISLQSINDRPPPATKLPALEMPPLPPPPPSEDYISNVTPRQPVLPPIAGQGDYPDRYTFERGNENDPAFPPPPRITHASDLPPPPSYAEALSGKYD